MVAVLAGLTLIGIRVLVPATSPGDESAYWYAALRIREGEPLYYIAPGADTETIYRYAPWLAWVWIPLTFLPQPVAYLLWEGLLLACAVYIIWRLASLGGPAAAVLAALALPMLGAVESGNVQTALIAALMFFRAGPVSVGLAGSLKVYPLALCIGYVAERRWRDLVIAVGLTGILWLPAIAYGFTDYPADVQYVNGSAWAFWWAPLLVAPVLGVTGWLAARGSRWTWLAVGAALPLVVPHYVGITFIFVAAVRLGSVVQDAQVDLVAGRPRHGDSVRQ